MDARFTCYSLPGFARRNGSKTVADRSGSLSRVEVVGVVAVLPLLSSLSIMLTSTSSLMLTLWPSSLSSLGRDGDGSGSVEMVATPAVRAALGAG
jgi:hypothetical protein